MTAFAAAGVQAEEGPLFLPLDELTNSFSIATVTVTNSTTIWEAPDVTLRFFDASRRLEFNDTIIWMSGPVSSNAALQRTLSEADVETVLAPLLLPGPPPVSAERLVVILDPGHGGDDPGAIVPGIAFEKDLVLSVANRVCRRLREAGITVRMTRGTDKTLTLEERTGFAKNKAGAVLVSIHANKAANKVAQGLETYIMPVAGFPSTSAMDPVAETYPGNRYDAESLQLAYYVHREILDQTQAVDRGVKRARFEVLRNAPCPAALVEIGFLSNTEERGNLETPDYLNRLADGIAFGIRVFILQNTLSP